MLDTHEIMSSLPNEPGKEDGLDYGATVSQRLTNAKEDIDQIKRQLDIFRSNLEQNSESEAQLEEFHVTANIQILEQLIFLLRNQHDYATMLMLAGKFGTAEKTVSLNLLNATLAEYKLIYSLIQTDLISEIIKSRNNWQVGNESVGLRATTLRLIIQAFTDMEIEISINQLAELFNFIV